MYSVIQSVGLYVQFSYITLGEGYARVKYIEMVCRMQGIMQKACKSLYKLYVCQLTRNPWSTIDSINVGDVEDLLQMLHMGVGTYLT